jgi:hypothetical protein
MEKQFINLAIGVEETVLIVENLDIWLSSVLKSQEVPPNLFLLKLEDRWCFLLHFV